MVALITGLILLALPFVLVNPFFDKKTGFIYVLFFVFLLQISLGFLAQALGIFYYWVVFGCTLLADLVLLFMYFRRKISFPKFELTGVDWVMLFVNLVFLKILFLLPSFRIANL